MGVSSPRNAMGSVRTPMSGGSIPDSQPIGASEGALCFTPSCGGWAWLIGGLVAGLLLLPACTLVPRPSLWLVRV